MNVCRIDTFMILSICFIETVERRLLSAGHTGVSAASEVPSDGLLLGSDDASFGVVDISVDQKRKLGLNNFQYRNTLALNLDVNFK